MSRKDQKLEPQRDALLTDGCERVFEEKISSREAERGALREAFEYCREGDVLVVARLDRLGEVPAGADRLGRGAGGQGSGLPEPQGVAGHHDCGRQADLPRLRGTRGVREVDHPREGDVRAGIGQGTRETQRETPGTQREQCGAGSEAQGEGEHSVEEICSMLGVDRSTLYSYLGEDDGGSDARG